MLIERDNTHDNSSPSDNRDSEDLDHKVGDQQQQLPQQQPTSCSQPSYMNISAYSMQGRRAHMEDFFDIAYQMKPCDKQRPNEWPYEYFYFGIFDGHGGGEAAKFAKENLLKFITKQAGFWSDNDDDVMRAIQKGYSDTHAAMRSEMSQWSRTNRVLPSTAGTTASVLFIKNGKYYTGHVGDSRIVISRENPETKQWISDQITEDHKPESEVETTRITRAGGEVKNKLGVHRVVWRRPVLKPHLSLPLTLLDTDAKDYKKCLKQLPTYPISETLVESYQTIPFLAIARSLGDFWSINPYSGQYIVSPEPDVSCQPISPDDKSILLATDGLWNVLGSSQAVRALQEIQVVKQGKRDEHPFNEQFFTTDNFYDISDVRDDNHALSLVYMAYQIWERRHIRSDNITAVVVMLNDILGCYQQSNQASTLPKSTTSASCASKQYIELKRTSNESKQNFTMLEPIQLGETYIFCENIRPNQKPTFMVPLTNAEQIEFLQKLDNLLVFPPNILEQELIYDYGFITPPRNYLLLSKAYCRKFKRYDSASSDSYIFIKEVSDDPDDTKRVESRKSKSGKEVRDSSAQATQSMHDFGQPWDQLEAEVKRNYSDRELDALLDSILHPAGIDADEEMEEPEGLEEELEDDDDEEEGIDDEEEVEEEIEDEEIYEEAGDEDEREIARRAMKLVENHMGHTVEDDKINPESVESDNSEPPPSPLRRDNQSGKSMMPQLRCLMDCNSSTPPTLRRLTRSGAYLSLTENPKRKTQPSPDLPKSKRRKSHPVHVALAQA